LTAVYITQNHEAWAKPMPHGNGGGGGVIPATQRQREGKNETPARQDEFF